MAEETDDASTGGDAACWLPRVCKECGALVEAELPTECWRCGAMVLSVGYSDSN